MLLLLASVLRSLLLCCTSCLLTHVFASSLFLPFTAVYCVSAFPCCRSGHRQEPRRHRLSRGHQEQQYPVVVPHHQSRPCTAVVVVLYTWCGRVCGGELLQSSVPQRVPAPPRSHRIVRGSYNRNDAPDRTTRGLAFRHQIVDDTHSPHAEIYSVRMQHVDSSAQYGNQLRVVWLAWVCPPADVVCSPVSWLLLRGGGGSGGVAVLERHPGQASLVCPTAA